jgi:3,4-dihydroxy 2-butanone 4-phosphate synthase
VVVYDFDYREGEADIIYAAETVTPDAVVRLRNDAGGLICTALSYEVAEAFDLPYSTTRFSTQPATS